MRTVVFTIEQAKELKKQPMKMVAYDNEFNSYLFAKVIRVEREGETGSSKIWQDVRVTGELYEDAKKHGNLDQLLESLERNIDAMIDKRAGKKIPFITPES